MPFTAENKAQLESRGYTVVKGVIPVSEADKLYSQFWDWHESAGTGLKRNDRSTWTSEQLPFGYHGGLLQYFQVGHSQVVWDARQNYPEIQKVFTEIWKDHAHQPEDLIVSFDGASMMFPAKPSQKPVAWPHLDQGAKKAGKFECVQGFINLRPCGPDDGGLHVLVGSNNFHKEFFEDKNHTQRAQGDWFKFKWDDLEFYKKRNCVEAKVCCAPGDLVLWDSRTVHWATQPVAPNSIRSVIYICMVPAEWADVKTIEKRRAAFKALRMTSHWPHRIKLFNKEPRSIYMKNKKPFKPTDMGKPPVLNANGKRLASLDLYTNKKAKSK